MQQAEAGADRDGAPQLKRRGRCAGVWRRRAIDRPSLRAPALEHLEGQPEQAQRDDQLDRGGGQREHPGGAQREADAVSEGESAHQPEQVFEARDEQHQPEHEEHVVDAAQEVLDTQPQKRWRGRARAAVGLREAHASPPSVQEVAEALTVGELELDEDVRLRLLETADGQRPAGEPSEGAATAVHAGAADDRVGLHRLAL